MSFKSDKPSLIYNKYDLIEIKLPPSSRQGEWGSWFATECYKSLDIRIRNAGLNYDKTKHKWNVQFRNRYTEKIYFSYEVYDSKPSDPRSTNRKDLESNGISYGNRDFPMNNGSSIYVYVDEVRFKKDGIQEYYNCDK